MDNWSARNRDTMVIGSRNFFLLLGFTLVFEEARNIEILWLKSSHGFLLMASIMVNHTMSMLSMGQKNHLGKFDVSSNKVSHVYSQPGSPRCPVVILDLYLSNASL